MSDGNYVAGIDKAKIDALILEINDYAEKINNILTNIDDLVATNIDYFNCSSKEKFKKIHNENRSNFKQIVNNVLNYADDLTKIKRYYSDINSNISNNITKSISKIGEIIERRNL